MQLKKSLLSLALAGVVAVASTASLALAGVVAVASTALVGCVSNTTSNSSTTNRSQLMLVSEQEVMTQSAQAYDEVIAQARAQGVLNTNKALTARVQKIGDRLIAKAPTFRADSAKWDWEVNVITSKELNAWCMAGGKIAVYTALVEQLQLNDDEIATVMGHEIAHALREHVREQMSTQALKQGALNIASLFGVSNTTLNIANTLAEVGVSLPFSRSHETEADELGLELMYRAGYDPQKGIKIWEKMMSLGSGNTGLAVLLSTHPADDERLANLTELAAQLKADK